MEFNQEIEHLKVEVAANPSNLSAYTDLGNKLLKAGRTQEAAEIFFHVHFLKPDDPDFLYDYGVALQLLGENLKAALQFWRVLDINPNHGMARCNLEAVLNDLDDASGILETTADEANIAGVDFQRNGEDQKAALQFWKAINIDPDHELAHSNLGFILNILGDTKGALYHCKKSLKLNPDNANTLNNYGVVLHQMERMNESILVLIKATKLKPDSPVTFRNLGLSFQAIGRLKDARTAYRHAISLDPKNGTTYRYIADISTYTKYTREVKMMEDTLAAVPEKSESARNLHFALGKVFNDLKEHNKCIYHLFSANKLHRGTFKYHPESYETYTDRIIKQFPSEIQLSESKSEKTPIFIVGMPRSGSTLVEQILASHSKVFAAGEIKNLNKNAVKLVELLSPSGKEYPEGMSDFDEKGLAGLGEAYLNSLKPLSDKNFITNKMAGNFFYIGLILTALPNARIIHTVRNPIDTCFSCYTKYFSDGHLFTYNLHELGRYYKNYIRLMEHWHTIFPGRILDIEYEKVVENQKTQTRKLLEHCGLEWEDACISFHETQRTVLTASANQVRSPIYSSAVMRSKDYLKYLAPLLEELGLESNKNKK